MVPLQYQLNSAFELAKMESIQQELKKFVTSWGWTYSVIWRIGPDHRTPIWHQSYFNEFEEREAGQAQRFENTYKRCRFTHTRPGYAYLAWHRQSPYWWTRKLRAVPTDENKELFLAQSNIQTLVCFPGRAPSPDGSGFCVELASTSLVPDSEYFKVPIRDFIATSIAPHMCLTSSVTSLQQEAQVPLQQAMTMGQGSAILPDIMTSQAAAIRGVEDGAVAANLARQELDPSYYSWPTMSSSSASHLVSAGAMTSNITSPLPNFGDYNQSVPSSFDIATLTYDIGASSDPLLEPFQVELTEPEWSGTAASTSSTSPHVSRKGKEILGFDADQLGRSSIHEDQSLPLPSTSSTSSDNLSILQLEFLEKLKNPPPAPQQLLGPSLGSSSSSSAFSAGLRLPIDQEQLLPGQSPMSLFKPHNHARFPRFGAISKRQPLIHRWAKVLAPLMGTSWRRPGGGGGGLEGHGGLEDPNSVAQDHLAAESHRNAERKRRSKMNNKLRTLISIVPIIDKKDKVSVLSSTIEYIRQLTSQISRFENKEEAPATTSRPMEDEVMRSTTKEEEEPALGRHDSAVDSTAAPGPSSSSSSMNPVVVVEAGSPGGVTTWLVKVQATTRMRSLVQLLEIFQDLGLEVTTVESNTTTGRFRANVSVKNSKNSSMSSSELRETLCRALETVESPPTDSDN